ncbi:MAG: hypothetical protein U1F43_28540 [Myxococcota bacterium]
MMGLDFMRSPSRPGTRRLLEDLDVAVHLLQLGAHAARQLVARGGVQRAHAHHLGRQRLERRGDQRQLGQDAVVLVADLGERVLLAELGGARLLVLPHGLGVARGAEPRLDGGDLVAHRGAVDRDEVAGDVGAARHHELGQALQLVDLEDGAGERRADLVGRVVERRGQLALRLDDGAHRVRDGAVADLPRVEVRARRDGRQRGALVLGHDLLPVALAGEVEGDERAVGQAADGRDRPRGERGRGDGGGAGDAEVGGAGGRGGQRAPEHAPGAALARALRGGLGGLFASAHQRNDPMSWNTDTMVFTSPLAVAPLAASAMRPRMLVSAFWP